MKRQLVEELKSRMKLLQEREKSHTAELSHLEHKVKVLTEEASNRRALVDSLKRRLAVASREKSQQEAACLGLRQDLEKKSQRVEALQARVSASERSQSQLEQTATRQLEGLAQQSSLALDALQGRLTQQSSLALDALQGRLGLATKQLEQLTSFTKALASEVLVEVQEVRSELCRKRKRKRLEEVGDVGLKKSSVSRAQAVAASILNMTPTDLLHMLDTPPDTEEASTEDSRRDQEWLEQVMAILQQQIPAAGRLMEAVRVKMKERKVLTEELAALTAPVSEKA
ncbi:centlein [Osmerus eperlanus]|uniref:centlein n=1 Tax=Osmerus eperlanus TaxID=29151 RepID=UPI002E0E6C19